MPPRLFALDHNFPQPVLAAMAHALPQVELVPIRDIDPTFADLDDWELLCELHRHERPWDGMITNDDAMLSLPKEMTVLSQTGRTLVVAKGEGHNPIRAVGTLLCHLTHICHHMTPGIAADLEAAGRTEERRAGSRLPRNDREEIEHHRLPDRCREQGTSG